MSTDWLLVLQVFLILFVPCVAICLLYWGTASIRKFIERKEHKRA